MSRIVGLGFRDSAPPEALAAARDAAEAAHGPVAAVAVLDARAAHPGLSALGLPVIVLPRPALAGVATPSQSARVQAAFGCGSVAEALAMLAAGAGLIAPRQVVAGVTYAVAGCGGGPTDQESEARK